MKRAFKFLATMFNDPLPDNNVDYFAAWIKYGFYGFVLFSWIKGLWYATLQMPDKSFEPGLYTLLCSGFFFLVTGLAALCIAILLIIVLADILPDMVNSFKDKVRKPIKW